MPGLPASASIHHPNEKMASPIILHADAITDDE
jgi:hypothetical protein